MEMPEQIVESMRTASPIVWIGLGIAIVFLFLGMRLILKGSQSKLAAFSSPSGNVLVSKKALQELVKQACMLEEWVEAARPVIRLEEEKVSALIELRLAAPDNLKDVCERVQARVTELLRKSLSFEHVGSIQIVVKSFGNARRTPAEEAKSNLLPASAPPAANEGTRPLEQPAQPPAGAPPQQDPEDMR